MNPIEQTCLHINSNADCYCTLPLGHEGAHLFKQISETPAMSAQVGGDHYKNLPIQPVEFCQKNRFGCCESAAIKYISRHRGKNGAEDIRKAIHYLELLLEIEYKEAK